MLIAAMTARCIAEPDLLPIDACRPRCRAEAQRSCAELTPPIAPSGTNTGRLRLAFASATSAR